MFRWGFPILRRFGIMPPAPAAAPPPSAPAAPTVANGAPSAPTTELTPEEEQELQELKRPRLAGTETTSSGLEAEIWYHPVEERYSVKFGSGYELFNKNREFRSYDDAKWYVTDVVGSRDDAAEEQRATGLIVGVPDIGAYPIPGGQTGPTAQTSGTRPPPARGRFM